MQIIRGRSPKRTVAIASLILLGAAAFVLSDVFRRDPRSHPDEVHSLGPEKGPHNPPDLRATNTAQLDPAPKRQELHSATPKESIESTAKPKDIAAPGEGAPRPAPRVPLDEEYLASEYASWSQEDLLAERERLFAKHARLRSEASKRLLAEGIYTKLEFDASGVPNLEPWAADELYSTQSSPDGEGVIRIGLPVADFPQIYDTFDRWAWLQLHVK